MRLLGSILAVGVFISTTVEVAVAAPIPCPVIVDRQTAKFTRKNSRVGRAKHRCYSDSTSGRREARRYATAFTTDDFVSSSSCSASPSPSGSPGTGTGTGLNLTGPGERESIVFVPTSGGTVTYNFPGGGEFEIKVRNALNNSTLQELIETTQAAAGTVSFDAGSSPVYIKVEGPGSWSVDITIN